MRCASCPGHDGRGPSLQSEPSFFDGEFEIQDEGSQLVTLLAGAQPARPSSISAPAPAARRWRSLRFWRQSGRIFATDLDSRRLAPLHDRLARSGAGNVEVRVPKSRGHDALADLAGTVDLVLVDAPCTGSGTWRRNPDAKWRVRPGALAERIKEQAQVLDRAASLVKPGGRIAYITCSMLPEENDEAVEAFLGAASALRACRDALLARHRRGRFRPAGPLRHPFRPAALAAPDRD
jgi:16S rRNA (cytosine967-C5)-methyltransferase